MAKNLFDFYKEVPLLAPKILPYTFEMLKIDYSIKRDKTLSTLKHKLIRERIESKIFNIKPPIDILFDSGSLPVRNEDLMDLISGNNFNNTQIDTSLNTDYITISNNNNNAIDYNNMDNEMCKNNAEYLNMEDNLISSELITKLGNIDNDLKLTNNIADDESEELFIRRRRKTAKKKDFDLFENYEVEDSATEEESDIEMFEESDVEEVEEEEVKRSRMEIGRRNEFC